MDWIYEVLPQYFLWINALLAIVIIYAGRKRPARSTMMWLMVLALFPVIGFFPYLLLGRDTRKANVFRLKQGQDLAIREVIRTQKGTLSELPDFFADSEERVLLEEIREIAILNLNNSNAVISADNEVRVFTDGRKKFDALIEDIDRAQRTVELQYYIFKSDGLGTQVMTHLVAAAERGVRVRFLTDGLGCRRLCKADLREMRAAGIEVAIFSPSLFKVINFRMNYRNHRKLVVIDDVISYIGGFNVGDEYLGKDARFGYWRDTHLRIVGSAAQAIKMRFLQDWYYASGQDPSMEPDFQISEGPGEIPCQMISSGPDTKKKNIKLAMVKMINQANRRIDIQTPYFIPDPSFQEAMTIALQQGVEVNIMIPNQPDHPIVYPATLSFVSDLIAEGAHVYRYEGGFLHSKVLLVDEIYSLVGSANVDERSFSLNFEASEMVYSSEVNQILRQAFEQDQANSTLITPERWAKRPLRYKILSPVCRLFAPIL